MTDAQKAHARAEAFPEGLTREAADFAVGLRFEDIPAQAIRLVRRCFIDSIGVAMAGTEEPALEIAERHLAEYFSDRGSRRIGDRVRRVPASKAAFWNGLAGHAMDWDDTQLSEGTGRIYGLLTHPSMPLTASLLALCDARGPVDGRGFVTAFVAGFEVECKIAESIHPRHYGNGFHSSGTIGTFGAAVASAKLLGLDVEGMRRAIGIAASMAAGIRANFGTMTKPLHVGRASENGLNAALLAAEGFTADPQALDGRWGYLQVAGGGADLEYALGRFGRPFAILEPGVSIKPYPCGVLTHPSMDAMATLVRRHGLQGADIAAVRLHAGSNILNPIRYPIAGNALEGKFSMPFLLSAIALRGRAGKREFTDEFVRSAECQAMQRRVQTVFDPEIDAMGYDCIRSRVEVTLANGHTLVEWANENYRGGPHNPFSDADVEAKFRDCASGLVDETVQGRILEFCWSLEQHGDVGRVLDLLHWRGADG